MFKIKTPDINEIKYLEEYFKENTDIALLGRNKLVCLVQGFIPHGFRRLPSIHIAIEGKNILGFVILKCVSKTSNSWQISNVYVLDEVRNKGIGEELLRYVLSVYGGYGIEHFLAEVDSQNFPALSLFHECGFRRYAKVHFFEKEIIDAGLIHELTLQDREFLIRPQTSNDFNELEKLELSVIPPDLRPALGRSKEYFLSKKDAKVLIDKSRNLIVGWAYIQKISDEHCLIEFLTSPGWTHLYEQFLNTIICDCIAFQNSKFTLTVKSFDYISELTQILIKSGYLAREVKELLVKTIWQKVKERKANRAPVGVPGIAPT